MGAAKYVSRVRGLALAAGLSVAVMTGQGVASADPLTGESPPETSSQIDAAQPPGDLSAISGDPSTMESVEVEPEQPTSPVADTGGQTEVEVPSAPDREEPPAVSTVVPEAEAPSAGVSDPNATGARPDVIPDDDGPDEASPSAPTTIAPLNRLGEEGPLGAPEAPAPNSVGQPSAAPSRPTALSLFASPSDEVVQTAPFFTAPAALSQPSFSAARPAQVTLGLLFWVGLAPLIGGGGAPPMAPPTLWTLLWFARRQHQYHWHNHAPTAEPTTAPQGEGGEIVGDLNATDREGDPITYRVVRAPSHGAVSVNSDGTFQYTPDAEWAHESGGNDAFTVEVSDKTGRHHHHFLWGQRGHGTRVVVPVGVAQVNEAPVLNVTVDEPDPVTGIRTYTVTASDPDDDDLEFNVSAPAHGTLIAAGAGAYTYTPDIQYFNGQGGAGSDEFVVTINDGHGGTDSETITVPVVVGPMNMPPVISVVQQGEPDSTGSITYSVNVSDPEEDSTTLEVTGGPTHGELIRNLDGTYTYTPSPDHAHDVAGGANGADQFTFTATDGIATVTSTVNVTVAPQNTAPTVDVSSGTPTGANGSIVYTVTGHDEDGDPLTVTFTEPAHGTVVRNADGTLTYTPDGDYAHAVLNGGPNTDSFTVTVDDGHGGIVSAVPVEVTVIGANALPSLKVTPLGSPDANGVQVFSVTVTDSDVGDVHEFEIVQPENGTVVANSNGTYTFTPDPDFYHLAAQQGGATETFWIKVTDGHGGESEQTVNVDVAHINAAPTISYLPTVPGAYTGVVTAEDPDGDTPIYLTVDAEPENGDVVLNADGTYTYTPDSAYAHSLAVSGSSGTDRFTVYAVDVFGARSEPLEIMVNVLPTNEVPTLEISLSTDDAGSEGVLLFDIVFDDVDDEVYPTFSDPAKGSLIVDPLEGGRGNFRYVPDYDEYHEGPGTDTFTVTIDDGHGGIVIRTIAVEIPQLNRAPEDVHVGGYYPYTGTVVAVDEDETDTITYELASGPANGTVEIDPNGNYRYVPFEDYAHGASVDAEDHFTVRADDGHGGQVEISVTIQVIGTNTPPTLTVEGPTVTDAHGGLVLYTAAGQDPDAHDQDSLTYEVVAGPQHGTVEFGGNNEFLYIPDLSYYANQPAGSTDTFTVGVTDRHGATASEVVTVVVAWENDVPVLTSQVQVDEGDPVTGVVTGGFTATDSVDRLEVTVSDPPSKGSVDVHIVEETISFTYEPSPEARHAAAAVGATDADKADTFTILVDDGYGGRTPVVITVAVLPST
ncbi:hypothetical protein BFL43_03770 [Williamsia sp. 1135]|nr:hypothetical protein BFL43_03770 [Williamsia sp. 1135]